MASSGGLVQYVVVRSDLIHVLKWPFGAVITQACHASSAVLHRFYTDPNTQAYLSDLDRMHKVVLQVMELLSFSNRYRSVRRPCEGWRRRVNP